MVLLECITSKLRRFISKYDIFVFAAGFISTFLIHGYMFTNKFINHDDVGGMFSDLSFGLGSGRWFLQSVSNFTGNFSSSWLGGLFCSLLVGLSVLLFVRMFCITHKLTAVAVALIMVSFPSFASMFSYMFCAVEYAFAFFLSFAAAYLIKKEKIPYLALGVVLIAFSMGCYQAYICTTAALLLFSIIIEILTEPRGEKLRVYIFSGLKYLLCLALGFALYFGILKFELYLTGTKLTDYKGIEGLYGLSPSVLLERMGIAYEKFFAFFSKENEIFREHFHVFAISGLILDGIMFVLVFVKRKLYKKPLSVLALLCLISIIPLACNSAYLMTETDGVHLLMLYPCIFPALIPAICLDRFRIPDLAELGNNTAKLLKTMSLVVCVLLITVTCSFVFEYTVITNRAYFYMDTTYEATYAFFTKLTAKIELEEGFTSETQVALMGNAKNDSVYLGIRLPGMPIGASALNIYSRDYFINFFLGTKYNSPSDIDKEELKKTEQFKNMPCYPDEGSIDYIGDILVVKFSD